MSVSRVIRSRFPNPSRSDAVFRRGTPLVAAVLAISAVACSDSVSPKDVGGRIRIVNSVFQGTTASTAIPVAVDALIDSVTAAPGLSNLAANSISSGAATVDGTGSAGAVAGAPARFTAAGYRDITSALHTFVARVAGTTGPTSNVFRNSTGTGEYAPQQYVTPFPYTLILAGIVPPAGTAASPTAVPFVILVDDPFTPPADATNSGLTARVQVINAAPFADTTGAGAGAKLTVTFAGSPGTYTATANYRGTSGYLNPPAGTYTLTITNGSYTLYNSSVTLAKGEVRSFIVQSTGYAATPSSANTQVLNLLDNAF